MTAYPIHDTQKKHSTGNIPECQLPLLNSSEYSLDDEKTLRVQLKNLDIFLSCTVICFFVVACWRGTWGLVDLYPNYFPLCETFFLSIFIHVVFALSQKFFHDLLIERPAQNICIKSLNYFLAKVYIFIFYLSTIMHWRAAWIFYEVTISAITSTGQALHFWNGPVVPAILFIVLMSLLLIWLGGVTNVTSTPMGVHTDTKEDTFLFNYRFFKMGERASLYVLDCLFSILIVGTLVVFVWRGVWLLVDIFMFPENEILSNWSSLAVGYFIVALAFLLQPMMRYLCERLTGTARLLVADLFILFALFGTVNVWRGIWNLLNIYFLPENLELSCWITHWVSFIILVLCRCSNSLLVRGVYIDAEEPAGKCVVFPCYYLRIIFRKKKLKKLNLTNVALNDSIKNKIKGAEASANNHIVNISTISNTVEENNDIKNKMNEY